MRNYLCKERADRNRPLIFEYVKGEDHGYHSRPGDIERIARKLEVNIIQRTTCDTVYTVLMSLCSLLVCVVKGN
jgi:hypothetical protein